MITLSDRALINKVVDAKAVKSHSLLDPVELSVHQILALVDVANREDLADSLRFQQRLFRAKVAADTVEGLAMMQRADRPEPEACMLWDLSLGGAK